MAESDQRIPVLFVDDEPAFLEGVRRSLRSLRADWDVSFLGSAQEALQALERFPVALVVSDWSMQGIDGLTFCRMIRDTEMSSDLSRYVIVLTGRQGTEDAVRALEEGADDYLTKPFDPRELVARIKVGLRLLALQRSLRETNRKLSEQASTDPLTGAFNRRLGMELLAGETERVRRDQQDLSVILADLDRFKAINDTHGHGGGDAALCSVVRQLKACSRRYDSIVRWGGDELMVICPHTGAEQSLVVAGRLREAIAAAPVVVEGAPAFTITCSMGVTTVPKGCRASIVAIVANADRALYRVKERGRNGVQHEPTTNESQPLDDAPTRR
ncbi:MAG: diguanylate cyclase [Deltaproteobacteria bacterium]|nr:diguanylate cyclase [Deltaproteobacteria bacterium]